MATMDRSSASGAHRVARGMTAGSERGQERGADGGGMKFEIRPGMTKFGGLVMLVGLAMSGWLVYYGFTNLKLYPPQGGMGAMVLFAILPLLFGILVLVMLAYAWFSAQGIHITVRKDGLKYVGGEVFFDTTWSRLHYVGPSHGFKGMRSIVIGNQQTRVRVDELFLPSFEKLVGFLDKVLAKLEGARAADD